MLAVSLSSLLCQLRSAQRRRACLSSLPIQDRLRSPARPLALAGVGRRRTPSALQENATLAQPSTPLGREEGRRIEWTSCGVGRRCLAQAAVAGLAAAARVDRLFVWPCSPEGDEPFVRPRLCRRRQRAPVLRDGRARSAGKEAGGKLLTWKPLKKKRRKEALASRALLLTTTRLPRLALARPFLPSSSSPTQPSASDHGSLGLNNRLGLGLLCFLRPPAGGMRTLLPDGHRRRRVRAARPGLPVRLERLGRARPRTSARLQIVPGQSSG
jgi:hypothetical protein